jgi:hypothetical protein
MFSVGILRSLKHNGPLRDFLKEESGIITMSRMKDILIAFATNSYLKSFGNKLRRPATKVEGFESDSEYAKDDEEKDDSITSD